MKREEIVHIAITKDEKEQLLRKLTEKVIEEKRSYTTSTFLREFLLKPYLNGSGSPPQETKEEEPTKKGVWDDIKL
jgi:hypothetical protein